MTGPQLSNDLNVALHEFYDTAMTNAEWYQAHPYSQTRNLYNAFHAGRIRGGDHQLIESRFSEMSRIYHSHFGDYVPTEDMRGVSPSEPTILDGLIKGVTLGSLVAASMLLAKHQREQRQRLTENLEDSLLDNSEELLYCNFTDPTEYSTHETAPGGKLFAGYGLGPDRTPGLQYQFKATPRDHPMSFVLRVPVPKPTREFVMVNFFYDHVYSTELLGIYTYFNDMQTPFLHTSGFSSDRYNTMRPHTIISTDSPGRLPGHISLDFIQAGWQVAGWSYSIIEARYLNLVINTHPQDIAGIPILTSETSIHMPTLFVFHCHTNGGPHEAIAISDLWVVQWGRQLANIPPFPKPALGDEPEPATRGR